MKVREVNVLFIKHYFCISNNFFFTPLFVFGDSLEKSMGRIGINEGDFHDKGCAVFYQNKKELLTSIHCFHTCNDEYCEKGIEIDPKDMRFFHKVGGIEKEELVEKITESSLSNDDEGCKVKHCAIVELKSEVEGAEPFFDFSQLDTNAQSNPERKIKIATYIKETKKLICINNEVESDSEINYGFKCQCYSDSKGGKGFRAIFPSKDSPLTIPDTLRGSVLFVELDNPLQRVLLGIGIKKQKWRDSSGELNRSIFFKSRWGKKFRLNFLNNNE